MTARDQHDARFALAMATDWPDLGDEGRHLVFQRLNLYGFVWMAHGHCILYGGVRGAG